MVFDLGVIKRKLGAPECLFLLLRLNPAARLSGKNLRALTRLYTVWAFSLIVLKSQKCSWQENGGSSAGVSRL